MPLFWFIVLFVHDTGRNRRNTLLLHGCCRLEATGRRVEAGLHVERGFMLVMRSKSVEELPSVPNGTRTYALHIRGSEIYCRLEFKVFATGIVDTGGKFSTGKSSEE